MVRNCQLSDLIYLTAAARAGAAEGVSVRERVGEPMGTEDTGFARPLPGPRAPSGAREVLPKLVSVSLKQAPPPPHLLPPPHAVTSFGFRPSRIREVTVIPYSRWLTTAKPRHQGHRFRNPPKLVASCPPR